MSLTGELAFQPSPYSPRSTLLLLYVPQLTQVVIPGARLFSSMVGQSFRLPLDFDYSVAGVVFWFVIVVVLSAMPSLWPAFRATRDSVREALSYE